MTPFQGRLLHVLPAKRKPGEDAQEGGTADKQVSTAQHSIDCMCTTCAQREDTDADICARLFAMLS